MQRGFYVRRIHRQYRCPGADVRGNDDISSERIAKDMHSGQLQRDTERCQGTVAIGYEALYYRPRTDPAETPDHAQRSGISTRPFSFGAGNDNSNEFRCALIPHIAPRAAMIAQDFARRRVLVTGIIATPMV